MNLLKIKTTSEEVKVLKVLLNKHLGATLDVTNPYFGDSTLAVVKQFQKKHGLLADGVVGDMTWSILQNPKPADVSTCTYLTAVIAKLATQVGVKEATGKNDGPEVTAYLNSVGLPKGYAWCQAFMYWGFNVVAGDLRVVNPMPKTAGVLDCWNKSKKYQTDKNSFPKVGDVFTMNFGKGQGHCGIVTKVTDEYIQTIEGNTSADPKLPSEDRDGQGVYRRLRKISSINNGFIRYSIPV